MVPIESCAKQQICVGGEQKHQEQTVPQNDISNHFSMLYITALDDYIDLSPQLITGFN